MSRSFFFWPLVRAASGRLTPVDASGNIYFFNGDQLSTMRVQMNEHMDTIPLEDAPTLEAMWAYLQRFRVGE